MDKFRKIIKDSGILADVKTTSEGAGLMSVLFKEVIEMLLLAEQEEHLAYKKSARNDSDNARNGYTSKKLKSKFGLLDIQVPRDRKGTFEPEILPKRVNKSPDLEDMVISLYSKGDEQYGYREFHGGEDEGKPIKVIHIKNNRKSSG